MKRLTLALALAAAFATGCDDKDQAAKPAPAALPASEPAKLAEKSPAAADLESLVPGLGSSAATPPDWGRVQFDGGQAGKGNVVSVPRSYVYGPRDPIAYTSTKPRFPGDLSLPPPPPPLAGADASHYAGLRAALAHMGSDSHVVDEIIRQSIPMGLDPVLMLAMGQQENSLKNDPTPSRSKSGRLVGALGVLQLMPATACEELGECKKAALLIPEINVRLGLTYFKRQLSQFGDPKLALAAYNAGPKAVVKYGNRVPPYEETQGYVKKIFGYYDEFRRFVS